MATWVTKYADLSRKYTKPCTLCRASGNDCYAIKGKAGMKGPCARCKFQQKGCEGAVGESAANVGDASDGDSSPPPPKRARIPEVEMLTPNQYKGESALCRRLSATTDICRQLLSLSAVLRRMLERPMLYRRDSELPLL